MKLREGLAVQLVGDDRVGQRLLELDRAVEGGHFDRRAIGAEEVQVPGGGFDSDVLQDVGEARSRPARVAHGSALPLNAGHARLVEGAPVAGALENAGRRRAGKASQVRESERDRSLDLSTTSLQLPRRLGYMGFQWWRTKSRSVGVM